MLNRCLRPLLDSAFLFLCGIMLFSLLGHYSLWDDEAMVALSSQGILSSGDTIATHGDNIVAYRSGLLLHGLCDRSTPPLAAYLAAPSIWLFGPTSFAARMPFALIGMSLMTLVVWVLKKTKVPNLDSFFLYLAITGNVSLFLYLRQCRYYAPTIFLVSLIILFYATWDTDRKKNLLWIVLIFPLLFSANYMACVALSISLVFDYVIWKRRSTPFPLKSNLSRIAGSLLLCLLIALIWNPYKTGLGAYTQVNSLAQRFSLFLWNLRDTAECQFWVTGLLLAGFAIAVFQRDLWLLRGMLILFSFILAATLFSPQLILGSSVADVRYLAAIIPLGVALSVRSFGLLFGAKPLLALSLCFPFFWTNLVSGAFFGNRPLRSLPVEFFQELLAPPSDPYAAASKWIRGNVSSLSTVWVLPDYACYPLMFHAPQAVYAWQLRPEQKNEDQFKNLADIHFQGLVLPDYIVVFGPSVVQIRELMGQWSMQGMHYQEVTRLMTFWKDLYRPELFWRTFKPIENFDPNTEGIYIFKKQS